jgi:hypothetical protein
MAALISLVAGAGGCGWGGGCGWRIKSTNQSSVMREEFVPCVQQCCECGTYRTRRTMGGEITVDVVRVEGVELTNNAAERALSRAVLWRRKAFGTQSTMGSEFVERIP